MAISTPAQARSTAAPAFEGPDEYGAGLERWNLQAWVDFIAVKLMMARIGPVRMGSSTALLRAALSMKPALMRTSPSLVVTR